MIEGISAVSVWVRYALRCTDRRQLSPTEYPRNKQSGRTLMQMAAA
jgi:hypothetical protein